MKLINKIKFRFNIKIHNHKLINEIYRLIYKKFKNKKYITVLFYDEEKLNKKYNSKINIYIYIY